MSSLRAWERTVRQCASSASPCLSCSSFRRFSTTPSAFMAWSWQSIFTGVSRCWGMPPCCWLPSAYNGSLPSVCNGWNVCPWKTAPSQFTDRLPQFFTCLTMCFGRVPRRAGLHIKYSSTPAALLNLMASQIIMLVS
ncbi:hypothetical protein GUJ93_ZPchr0005g14240 [Zizania palustris]|uniref:Uncharacterized protein n=1 Tax=Zizania palustris TaxID=103762 RepID=A0A8J5T5C6_ZIZPA|nr:hypothetical protein GUJ93_ZPchr0005g14240 [Zizania palustris]